MCSSYLQFWAMDKVDKLSGSVIHHRQNTLHCTAIILNNILLIRIAFLVFNSTLRLYQYSEAQILY
jgi:hypothetical protein